jgi:hypothetical protein
VDPQILSAVFLVVMAAATACFWGAFARRATTARHVRWAIAGAAIDVVGTVAVVVTARWLGWHVPEQFPTVARVHRVCAYVVSAWLVVQVASGALRLPLHKASGRPFLGLYTVTYALAVWAYAPWW